MFAGNVFDKLEDEELSLVDSILCIVWKEKDNKQYNSKLQQLTLATSVPVAEKCAIMRGHNCCMLAQFFFSPECMMYRPKRKGPAYEEKSFSFFSFF